MADTSETSTMKRIVNFSQLTMPESRMLRSVENYIHWAVYMNAFFIQAEVDFLIKKDYAYDEAKHKKHNSVLYQIIYQNVVPEILGSLLTCQQHGIEAWEQLREQFASGDIGSLIEATSTYGQVRWDGGDLSSLDTFLSSKNEHRVRLRELGFDIPSERFAIDVLMSVPPSTIPVAALAGQMFGQMTFEVLRTHLRSHTSLNAFAQSNTTSALVARIRSPGAPKEHT